MIEIGPHRLLCADITTGAVSALMGATRADVIYSDPPWGEGNQKFWHTHNGTKPRTNYADFLAAFCQACAKHRQPDAPVFVEMGLRWVDDLDAAMAAVGLPRQRRWAITYNRPPLPNALLLYGPRDIEIDLPVTHGPPVTAAVLERVVLVGAVVLDPCTGKGMTARNTHRLGGLFRGCELNPKRLDITAEWLRKHEHDFA